jgi:thiol-disulfide isomerase/thioredoxin
MKRDTKKQMFAIFMLVTFVGSTAAIAFMSSFGTEEEKVQLIVDKPLTNAEEAAYLQKNYVVLKYFYSDECTACDTPMVEQLVQDLAGKIIIEEIDTMLYPEEATTYSVQSVPYYYFKGSTITKLSGNVTSVELFNAACDIYFEPIDQCSLI